MSFDILGIIAVPAIAIICYLVGIGVKASPLDDKFIPIIVGVIGGIIGVVAFLTGMPNFPAKDVITAIAVGIVSGLASTGINQIYKQLKKGD
ncbi:MAG: enolase [Lachnospiraceae bacterium]|nr:enolase [Lachnospiraceae bacterium]